METTAFSVPDPIWAYSVIARYRAPPDRPPPSLYSSRLNMPSARTDIGESGMWSPSDAPTLYPAFTRSANPPDGTVAPPPTLKDSGDCPSTALAANISAATPNTNTLLRRIKELG